MAVLELIRLDAVPAVDETVLFLEFLQDHLALLLVSICRLGEHAVVSREEGTTVDVLSHGRLVLLIRLLGKVIILIVFLALLGVIKVCGVFLFVAADIG